MRPEGPHRPGAGTISMNQRTGTMPAIKVSLAQGRHMRDGCLDVPCLLRWSKSLRHRTHILLFQKCEEVSRAVHHMQGATN